MISGIARVDRLRYESIPYKVSDGKGKGESENQNQSGDIPPKFCADCEQKMMPDANILGIQLQNATKIPPDDQLSKAKGGGVRRWNQ
jgi:hypothetical protein